MSCVCWHDMCVLACHVCLYPLFSMCVCWHVMCVCIHYLVCVCVSMSLVCKATQGLAQHLQHPATQMTSRCNIDATHCNTLQLHVCVSSARNCANSLPPPCSCVFVCACVCVYVSVSVCVRVCVCHCVFWFLIRVQRCVYSYLVFALNRFVCHCV